MKPDPFQLSLVVRYFHVAAAAVMGGGAVMVAAFAFASESRRGVQAAVDAAFTYEYLFWLVAGLSVATGVGNLGVKGPALLGTDTLWGLALFVKFTIVLCIIAVSVVRCDYILRLSSVSDM